MTCGGSASDPRRGLPSAGLDHPARRRRVGIRCRGRAARACTCTRESRSPASPSRTVAAPACARTAATIAGGRRALGGRRLRHPDRRHGRVEAADRHPPAAGFRDPVVQAGARSRRRLGGPSHLRLAERARRDAGRGGDRSLHQLLDAVDLSRSSRPAPRGRSISFRSWPSSGCSASGRGSAT